MKPKITIEDIDSCWEYHKEYLVDILNGDYELKDAQEDITGLIQSKWDARKGEK